MRSVTRAGVGMRCDQILLRPLLLKYRSRQAFVPAFTGGAGIVLRSESEGRVVLVSVVLCVSEAVVK